MEQAKFDQLFEQKLYHYEVKPQQGSWKRVEQKLPPKKRGNGKALFFVAVLSVFSVLPAHILQDEKRYEAHVLRQEFLPTDEPIVLSSPRPKDTIVSSENRKAKQTGIKESNSKVSPKKTNLFVEKGDIIVVEPENRREKELSMTPTYIKAEDINAIPMGQKQAVSIKIEITINPEALLESDTLRQAAPEPRPRKIQQLLRQIKRLTLEEE